RLGRGEKRYLAGRRGVDRFRLPTARVARVGQGHRGGPRGGVHVINSENAGAGGNRKYTGVRGQDAARAAVPGGGAGGIGSGGKYRAGSDSAAAAVFKSNGDEVGRTAPAGGKGLRRRDDR